MKSIFQNAIQRVKSNPEPTISDPSLQTTSNTDLDTPLDDIHPIKNSKSSMLRELNSHPYASTLDKQKKELLKLKFGSRLRMKDDINWAHDKDPSQITSTLSMLFIRNLHPDVNILQIKDAFDKFGMIKGIKVQSLKRWTLAQLRYTTANRMKPKEH